MLWQSSSGGEISEIFLTYHSAVPDLNAEPLLTQDVPFPLFQLFLVPSPLVVSAPALCLPWSAHRSHPSQTLGHNSRALST